MAYGFVKQSGGHIRLYSEVEEGTTVRVYLPRSTGTAVEPARSKASGLKHGNETILVVEDDAKVRETVVDLLGGLGYAVLKANNAEQALAVVESGVHIDMLFTDVVMPGALRSPEMVRRAVQMLPTLKVLYTSGYTQNAIVHGGRLDPGVELLSKPYSRQQLAFKICQVLGNDGLDATAAEEDVKRLDLEAGAVWEPARLRILVVEDDASLRGAVCELLTLIGITPQQAASGAQALAALRAGSVDILFTDIVMPDMSGIELAQRASELDRQLRVVFASGNPIPNHDTFAFKWTALRKPYTLDQLQHALQSMMAQERMTTDT
jgi:CheY-like chemotaxis protein